MQNHQEKLTFAKENTNKAPNMKCIGIIPARYASSRFPGKPLAMLGGKPLICRVYERVAPLLDEVIVATDDERIKDCVERNGGRALMTSVGLSSGTERVAEAFRRFGERCDVVFNIQGDEPFIRSEQIEAVRRLFDNADTQIGTAVRPFKASDRTAALTNANTPKVVLNKRNEVMYFSRSVIPFVRGKRAEDWLASHTFYKHIGLYAYQPQALREIVRLPPSSLEMAECLEQLRWLWNGYKIKVAVTDADTIGIDTPEDLARAESFLKQNPNY